MEEKPTGYGPRRILGLWSTNCEERPIADEIAKWKTKDEKAISTIILSVSSMQISYIRNFKSAKESWNTLLERIRNFSSTVEKLAETGIVLQEELFAVMLLASLPQSYENFVLKLETRDDLPKLSASKIKLMEEGESRKVNQSVSNDGDVQAFMTSNMKTKKYNNNQSNKNSFVNNDKNNRYAAKPKQNFKCGRRGHYAAECRSKQQNSTRKETRTHTLYLQQQIVKSLCLEEYKALLQNNTWELCDLPPNQKTGMQMGICIENE
ncbi:hypothetical protein EVAR_91363_1 [Eumeta japonica]|uniref:Retrovirus-related Pol polyprotein from transposon TNT 1-94 n=1 Tax=Eumeta variegata TaxID=151549 RepID=A0A4C1SW37_EUMVA|nr:hypothetical protein EVAR_91363_1 [Eumeta japonica]